MNALHDGPPLRLGVLFGSFARGTERADSDVDLGIVPMDEALPLRAELEMQARLEQACGRPVHLVRLDRATTLLKWKAACEGRVLLSEPPHAWPRFVAASASEYAELAPQLRAAEERFRARVASEPVR
ncbi:MAG: nucleotidyltransferase domain-containing protein [Thermodesulfobacteriota bacterium]